MHCSVQFRKLVAHPFLWLTRAGALSVPVTTVWGGRALRLQETLNLPAQLVRPFKLTEKGVGQIDTLVATATATAVAPPFPLRLAPGEEVVGVRCPFLFMPHS